MTMSVRFCLSYAILEWDFIAVKMSIISIRKRTGDTNVVNDVTGWRPVVAVCVLHTQLRICCDTDLACL